jgi:undecaprenyl-diphosphatase
VETSEHQRLTTTSADAWLLGSRGAAARRVVAALPPAPPAAAPAAVAAAGWAVIAPVLVAIGFVIVGLDESFGFVTDADRDVAAWLADQRTDVLDPVMSRLSAFADTKTVVGLVVGAGSMLALTAHWRRLTVVLVAVAVELTVYLSVTSLVARPRPDVAFGAVPVTGSYPSGHAAMAVALYGSLAIVAVSLTDVRWARRLAATVAIVAAVGTGLSRLYLGLHFLSDVVVGQGLGAAAVVVGVIAARALAVRLEEGPS